MLGVGVLRFIDQDVVDPLIELIHHPVDNIFALDIGRTSLQKIKRTKDKVGIVQSSGVFLKILKFADNFIAKVQQAGRSPGAKAFAYVLVYVDEPLRFGAQYGL